MFHNTTPVHKAVYYGCTQPLYVRSQGDAPIIAIAVCLMSSVTLKKRCKQNIPQLDSKFGLSLRPVLQWFKVPIGDNSQAQPEQTWHLSFISTQHTQVTKDPQTTILVAIGHCCVGNLCAYIIPHGFAACSLKQQAHNNLAQQSFRDRGPSTQASLCSNPLETHWSRWASGLALRVP